MSEVSALVKVLDDYKCIVTGVHETLSSSHLVPRSASEWWKAHQEVIQSYTPNRLTRGDLDSIYNQISLRSDLNAQCFDHGHFLLVPYGGKVVVLVIDPASETLAFEHHLREANFPDRIPRPYLFLRFVWNVLKANADALAPFSQTRKGKGKKSTKARDKNLHDDPEADDPDDYETDAPDDDEEGDKDTSMDWEPANAGAASGSGSRSKSPRRSSRRSGDRGQAKTGVPEQLTESYIKLLEAQDAALTRECWFFMFSFDPLTFF
ncbi:hypothetical protein C8R45DRAFT_483759 [Mycena sanguinolenta]|nr:hypothetical protein C8R45DRAFT_483759 [Mycena sanguinolenta]